MTPADHPGAAQDGEDGLERRVARAADLLSRPGAWLSEARAGGYVVRLGADSRRRPLLSLDEAVFRRLARDRGLKPRPEAGWTLSRTAMQPGPAVPPPGRPSVLDGERLVAEPDGRLTPRRANLGESPLAWLARRRDAQGRPWLDALEVRAGERLRDDVQAAGTLGRLTMAWDAGPKARGGRGPGVEPAERARAAKARVRAALLAIDPAARRVVETVCLAGTALQAAETALGLRRRSAKHLLKQGLAELARHYRLD